MDLLTDEQQEKVRQIRECHVAFYKATETIFGQTIALKALRDATQQAIGRSVEDKIGSLKINGSQPQD
jgi:hypothetical protein